MPVTRQKTLSLAQVRVRVAPRVAHGLVAAGMVLYDESQKLVPRDTEALGISAAVRQVSLEEVVVGYGRHGFTLTEYSPHEQREVTRRPEEYALVVHEDMEAKHPQGQAQYLLEPTKTKREEMRLALNAATKG